VRSENPVRGRFVHHLTGHSMQMVNAGFPEQFKYGFKMVDMSGAFVLLQKVAVNRKFTPNPINGIFRQFSAI
jgi:hypothetical protein